MRLTKKVHPFVEAYRRLWSPEGEPCITNIAGSIHAPILLLAEHPTEAEYDANTPIASPGGQVYSAIFNEAGFDLGRDFLILSFSRFGKKANKASTKDTFPFLLEHITGTSVRCVAMIGMEAFSHVFAGGRKTHARSIIGQPMYLPQLHSLPVFVLPDTTFIHSVDEKNWRLVNLCKDKQMRIFEHVKNLKKFVDTLTN